MHKSTQSSQAVQEFAASHRVRTKRDECGELIIPGKAGQVYEYGPAVFGVLLMLGTARQWNGARRRLEAAGFRTYQCGDCEGAALFDADNREQAKLALKLARVKQRRKLTPEQRQAAASRLNIARESKNSTVERHLGA